MTLTYIYLSIILLSFVASLRSFRQGFSSHLRFFSVLLGLTFLVELSADLTVRVLHWKNNYWIYHLFTLVEFLAYGYYYYQIIRLKRARQLLIGFMAIFPVFWMITVFFIFGWSKWNSYVIIVGSFFTVLFVLMYYYQLLVARDIAPLRGMAEFWIATGMLIFYMAALPFYGTLNFLLTYHRDVARTLYKVLLIIDTLMYAIFIYGYLCRTISIKRS
ncbi:MAG TPA: hypothetical protein VFE32_04660 [Puia sp.]|jgi:hypothetical protein|nr:hypothetical protein [Puia sp.]